ncbi:hypothetical protein E2C01_053800 [Portunus trituberculatus]|uniref:Uncharacterized protein n=1 Tax=Portunus trituberculatus TaxID=210409 RepID=A0A5B7GLA9_PORTR|nr:hypothetical protein [Portunus trituberculatus]
MGILRASVTVNGRTVEAEFYVVDSPTLEAIMGLDLLSDLGVTIIPATGRVLAVSEEDYLPAIKGYQHRIVLKKEAALTCQKLRRVPLSIREEVSQEIEKLRESGVIEPIEASECINPVIVAR